MMTVVGQLVCLLLLLLFVVDMDDEQHIDDLSTFVDNGLLNIRAVLE
jgi:hypothetical protein